MSAALSCARTRRRWAGLLLLVLAGAAQAGNTVVLLHGLARTAGSMEKMEDALKEAGYHTCNIGYPSTQHAIDVLVREHLLPSLRACGPDAAEPLNFVTHSMGGILVRQLRHSEPALRFGRVVMLGPPNHGSELVDRMGDWRLFRWVNGPAGQQLRTAPESVPNRLGAATFEVGIIAGNKPFLEPFAGYIAGPGDGKVSVESAKLAGMQDYLVLPVTHSFMMRNPDVIAQTIGFLRRGRFDHAAARAAHGDR